MKYLLNGYSTLRTLVAGLVLVSASFATAADTAQPAPDFTLPSNIGDNVRLAEQRGNVVLINFWASWCAPCRQEMPHLNAISDQYTPLGFSMLGVNVDADKADAERAIKALKVSFPVLFDSDNLVAELFKVDAMPTTVIIDRDGNLRHLHRGYKPGYEKEYAEQVAQLIRE